MGVISSMWKRKFHWIRLLSNKLVISTIITPPDKRSLSLRTIHDPEIIYTNQDHPSTNLPNCTPKSKTNFSWHARQKSSLLFIDSHPRYNHTHAHKPHRPTFDLQARKVLRSPRRARPRRRRIDKTHRVVARIFEHQRENPGLANWPIKPSGRTIAAANQLCLQNLRALQHTVENSRVTRPFADALSSRVYFGKLSRSSLLIGPFQCFNYTTLFIGDGEWIINAWLLNYIARGDTDLSRYEMFIVMRAAAVWSFIVRVQVEFNNHGVAAFDIY